jgi:hypothetical protein
MLVDTSTPSHVRPVAELITIVRLPGPIMMYGTPTNTGYSGVGDGVGVIVGVVLLVGVTVGVVVGLAPGVPVLVGVTVIVGVMDAVGVGVGVLVGVGVTDATRPALIPIIDIDNLLDTVIYIPNNAPDVGSNLHQGC